MASDRLERGVWLLCAACLAGSTAWKAAAIFGCLLMASVCTDKIGRRK